MLLPLAAASRLRLSLAAAAQKQQQLLLLSQQQQQQQRLLLSQQQQVLLQARGLKYIPFHGKNKKPRKVLPPPPVFAVDAVALAPQPDVLSDDQQGQQQHQQHHQQLSPFQAVQVLQAFLPLQPQPAPNAAAAANEPQRQQQSQRQADPAPAAAAATPAEIGEAEEASTEQPAADPLIYLTMKVRADLKRESVRGVCTLQHGVGSETKLAVFCADEEVGANRMHASWVEVAACR